VGFQISRGVEEHLAAGVHHPFDDLVHGIVQRCRSFAGVRQQAIAFGANISRVFELLLDEQGPALGADRRTPNLINPGRVTLRADRLVQLHQRLRPADGSACVEDRPDQLAQRAGGGLVVIARKHANDRCGLTGHFPIEGQVSFHTHHDEGERIGLLHGIDRIVHGPKEGPHGIIAHRRAVNALAPRQL